MNKKEFLLDLQESRKYGKYTMVVVTDCGRSNFTAGYLINNQNGSYVGIGEYADTKVYNWESLEGTITELINRYNSEMEEAFNTTGIDYMDIYVESTTSLLEKGYSIEFLESIVRV